MGKGGFSFICHHKILVTHIQQMSNYQQRNLSSNILIHPLPNEREKKCSRMQGRVGGGSRSGGTQDGLYAVDVEVRRGCHASAMIDTIRVGRLGCSCEGQRA